MFMQSLTPVLVSLLSLSAAAPTPDDCSQLTKPLTANELHQIMGKWILIEGFSNNEIFDSVLEHLESMWMALNTTANNQTLLLDQANPLPTHNATHLNPPEQHHPLVRDGCLRAAFNVTITDDKALEFRLEVSSTNHRLVQTCPDCLLMHIYTNENNYQALYLFGRNKTLAASDLETFRKQAACLQFPQPAKFHYDSSKELCPM